MNKILKTGLFLVINSSYMFTLLKTITTIKSFHWMVPCRKLKVSLIKGGSFFGGDTLWNVDTDEEEYGVVGRIECSG